MYDLGMKNFSVIKIIIIHYTSENITQFQLFCFGPNVETCSTLSSSFSSSSVGYHVERWESIWLNILKTLCVKDSNVSNILLICNCKPSSNVWTQDLTSSFCASHTCRGRYSPWTGARHLIPWNTRDSRFIASSFLL